MSNNLLSEIRSKFVEFFEARGHMNVGTSSIVPKNDPTLLFINSGMAPLKKYFLQEAVPPNKILVNSQHCLRVGGKHNDLSEVGYTKRHHTFFEMLGNFSFGEYFQKEAIGYAWDFLTNVIKLDKARLYVTIHPLDEDAYNLWKQLIDPVRIHKLEENVWSMGDVGPYGYCSEIFYDQNYDGTMEAKDADLSDDIRYLEIWNLVFMRYYADGKPENKDKKMELPKPCIDTGMGLERIVSVLEGVTDTYDIQFFKQALSHLNKSKNDVDSKIFLDHLRAISFMITEGIVPGPSSREYVLRRLMRRALKSFFNFEGVDFKQAVYEILQLWQKSYEMQFAIDKVYEIFNKEKEQFEQIIDKGSQIFDEMYKKSNNFTAQQLFLLHDTYGFSIDISMDLIKLQGGTFDLIGFEKLMEESKETSRSKSLNIVLPYDKTEFVEELEIEANILGFYDDYVVLDRTNFYAQGGGQVGDIGTMKAQGFELRITDTKKIDKVFIHKYELVSGTINTKEKVRCIFDNERRKQIRTHHSATHLLHQALCNKFGDSLKQMGSYVCEDRLRLDFGYAETITQEELVELENVVNAWIQENHAVKIEHMHFDKAVEEGAKAHFTYDDEVRTVRMGEHSFELCGGSHVNRTGDIGLFKILKASAISAGVKRIEAVCAKSAIEKVQQNAQHLKEIAQFLNIEEVRIIQKLDNMNKKKHSVNVEMKIQTTINSDNELRVGFCVATEISIEDEMARHSLDVLCVCSVSEKIGLNLKIAKNEKTKNLDAKEIMQELGSLLGARGCGGRKDFAQTGGALIENVESLFEKLQEILSK
jgi:alanyl-tRNA synthetase